MSDELEQWACAFQKKYHKEIEEKIHRQQKRMIREAGRIFRNLEATDYYTRINKLMAGLSYLRRCLQRVLDGDITWYSGYLKACIGQLYNVKDYPDGQWEEFFNKNRKKQTKILRRVKGDLLRRLSKY